MDGPLTPFPSTAEKQRPPCSVSRGIWAGLPFHSGDSHRYTHTHTHTHTPTGFPGDLVVKNSPANAGVTGDTGLIPGLGRSPGGGHGNPLQYSYLENSKGRGA